MIKQNVGQVSGPLGGGLWAERYRKVIMLLKEHIKIVAQRKLFYLKDEKESIRPTSAAKQPVQTASKASALLYAIPRG